jgi:DNA-binding response OmpR family regulator
VFVVKDEESISDTLSYVLRKEGFEADRALGAC